MTGLEQAVQLIHSGKRFLLTCHVMPDADAIGSMLGLAEILRSLGKEVVLYNRDQVPDMLTFLAGSDEVRSSLPAGISTASVFEHALTAAASANVSQKLFIIASPSWPSLQPVCPGLNSALVWIEACNPYAGW